MNLEKLEKQVFWWFMIAIFVGFFCSCSRAPSAIGRAMPHYLPHQGIAFQLPMRLLTRDEKGITWMDC